MMQVSFEAESDNASSPVALTSLVTTRNKASVCTICRQPLLSTFNDRSPPSPSMHRLQTWATNCKKGLHGLLAPQRQHVYSHELASLSPHVEETHSANLYDGLQDGQIRLFELDMNTTEYIVGRLRIVETSSAPPFYALSYVCGTDACSEEIVINNRVVLVRPNLFAALQGLRSYFQAEKVAQIAIWIDAICINQSNEDETSKEIRKMHRVFSGAVEMLVWLGAVDDNIRMVLRVFEWIRLCSEIGPDFEAYRQHGHESGYQEPTDESTRKALRSIILLSRCLEAQHHVSYTELRAMRHFLSIMLGTLRDLRDLSDTDRSQTWQQIDTALRTAADVPLLHGSLFPSNHDFWATLYTLVKVKWFGRIWTYQEIRMARRARLLAQGVCVPWDTVFHSIYDLFSALRFTGPLNEFAPGAKTGRLPHPRERSEALFRWSGLVPDNGAPAEGFSLIASLMITKHRVSTVAKDRMYGLMALWQSEVQAEVIIDYTKTTAEVFAATVKIGLKMESCTIADLWTVFECIDRSPPESATQGLPSWCPDFQNCTGISSRDRYRSKASLPQALVARVRGLACYEHTSGFETIAVRVLKLDKISKRTKAACPKGYRRTNERYFALCLWLQDLLEVFPSEGQANRSLRRDVQTYFYGDIERDPEFTFRHFSQGLARLACVSPSQLAGVLHDASVKRTLDRFSGRGLFFFLTDSGRLGYSTRQPCLGGHIVLVPRHHMYFGGALHMLNADCTQYVGCASIPGLMDDSFWESLDDMETKWEMVCLR